MYTCVYHIDHVYIFGYIYNAQQAFGWLLQHTATHCITLHHTATQTERIWGIREGTWERVDILNKKHCWHSVTHCSREECICTLRLTHFITLQHPATNCNINNTNLGCAMQRVWEWELDAYVNKCWILQRTALERNGYMH